MKNTPGGAISRRFKKNEKKFLKEIEKHKKIKQSKKGDTR